jgi:hypothetical protein
MTGKPLPPIQHYEPLQAGPCITKEEFGLTLYATITTIGGIMGLDRQRAAAIHQGHGYHVQELLTRRRALQVTLASQLPQLADLEMDQILERYPWVVTA